MSSVDDETSVASMFAALHVGSIKQMQAHDAIGKKLDEEDWLVPNWSVYVKHNFELPDPGHDKAVAELTQMVADLETPDYKGGKKGGTAKPIPSRWTALGGPGRPWTAVDGPGRP